MLTKNESVTEGPAIACDLTAIAPEQRGQHISAMEQLFALVQETRELPNGYAFRLPQEPDMWLRAAELIANERLCCPFFGFALELEPDGGPLWLKLTGGEGVKQFIQTVSSPVDFHRADGLRLVAEA